MGEFTDELWDRYRTLSVDHAIAARAFDETWASAAVLEPCGDGSADEQLGRRRDRLLADRDRLLDLAAQFEHVTQALCRRQLGD